VGRIERDDDSSIPGDGLAEAPGVWTPRAPCVVGGFGTLTWGREGDAQASVAFRVAKGALTLCYHDQHAAEPRDVEQHVALSSVSARFGGARAYFLCPGAECGRRVSVLYFHRGVWRCRQCHGLAYESQREDARRRARRRADKFRARLGWPQQRALSLTIVVKPKGM
jgi:ribosomal protein L37AE/L43A